MLIVKYQWLIKCHSSVINLPSQTIQLGLQASDLSENRNTRNKYSKASQEKNIFIYL